MLLRKGTLLTRRKIRSFGLTEGRCKGWSSLSPLAMIINREPTSVNHVQQMRRRAYWVFQFQDNQWRAIDENKQINPDIASRCRWQCQLPHGLSRMIASRNSDPIRPCSGKSPASDSSLPRLAVNV